MTDPEALDLAVAITGHRRFRELLDPSHADYEPGYWRVVRQIATGEVQPPPPPAVVPPPDFRRLKADKDRANACPHRTPVGSCRCDGYCALGRGREMPLAGGGIASVASLAACLECDLCPPAA